MTPYLQLYKASSLFLPDAMWMPSFTVFQPVTATDVHHVIVNLKNKSSKFDFVPTALLKECAQFFAQPIAHLANLSFTQSIFPQQLKTGCVRPILKTQGWISMTLIITCTIIMTLLAGIIK